MEVLLERCAGLDVHKETVVACARLMVGRHVKSVIEQFGTTTSELLRLVEWLLAQGCRHAVLEATGVYWKPVWHILEDQIELTLANAMEVRNVPGRKSDVSDAAWLADLLAHGLVRSSFVPPRPIQELRDLTRTRKQLSRQVAQGTQRIQKVLEDANLKITGIITHLLGVSGRAILQALIDGETNPERLLARTNGRLKAPRERLIEGLRGAVTDHHRFQLRLHLSQISSLERLLADLDAEIARHLEALSIATPAADHHPRRQRLRRQRVDRRDRDRHDPLPECWPPHLLGRSLPSDGRECWQATQHAHEKGSAMAQNHFLCAAPHKMCYVECPVMWSWRSQPPVVAGDGSCRCT